MLTRLDIRDFAVVARAEIAFGPGLTVISGETGAGKSLLVDALSLLCGQRADSGMIRHSAERAELHGDFSLDDAAAARDWLAEQELDDDGHCQLRRTLRADGGSRAWINGRPVTVAQLQALSSLLVEIHGQHAHQALLSRPAQLQLLDAFGRHADAVEAVTAAARHWQQLQAERERLVGQGDVGDRIAYLQHQLDELDAQPLSAESTSRLLAAHRRHAYAATLIQGCDTAAAALAGGSGSTALDQRLQRIRHDLAKVVEHEPRLQDVDGLLDAAAIQLQEAAGLLDRIRADLDIDPNGLDALEQQLSRLHELGRKHRVPIEMLSERRDAVAAELQTLRDADARLLQLDGQLLQARDDWSQAATRLTRARRQAAQSMAAATTALMQELGMGGGVFDVALEPADAPDPDALGAERAEFLVSANPGQPPRPLRKVASGGELARISLAIEVAALGLDAVPTMVFDEVDTGIGGAVAQIVGQKLRALGTQRQVLCVTHLPQVAAQGHVHYRVSKAAAEGLTKSAITRLDDAERVAEIARMLGGVDVGKEARAAARSLLRDAVS
ncbi:MAG: DNA repair protein RecN [Pseudoxanthomonas suwonensis]|nr:MAG: DNA repair protein RecN [Pseudoxanthomonas suwonensis]